MLLEGQVLRGIREFGGQFTHHLQLSKLADDQELIGIPIPVDSATIQYHL
jgi:hypothetical protein